LKTNKTWLREFFAEFLGTLFLVAVADASVAQMLVRAKLEGHGQVDFLSISFAFAFAIAFGVYISGGVSGGHINPAVTFTMCLFGRLKWTKLPVYWLAQYLGAFVGSAILYFTYFDSIDKLDSLRGPNNSHIVNSAGIFATFPEAHLNVVPSFLDQVVGTAILLMVVFALTDNRNAGVPKYLTPLLVGLTIGVIAMSYGIQCGFAVNPARDLAPRIFTLIIYGVDVFTKGSDKYGYYFWIPIVGPHVGAVIGAFIYQALIGAHWPDTYERSPTVTATVTLHEGDDRPVVAVTSNK